MRRPDGLFIVWLIVGLVAGEQGGMSERVTSWLLWLLGIDVPRAEGGFELKLEGLWTWQPLAVRAKTTAVWSP